MVGHHKTELKKKKKSQKTFFFFFYNLSGRAAGISGTVVNPGKPHSKSLVKGFVKMTENNYVIKEDHSKHETLNQCWADVGPASQMLGQHQPSIGSMSGVCRDGVVSSGRSFGGGLPAKKGH